VETQHDGNVMAQGHIENTHAERTWSGSREQGRRGQEESGFDDMSIPGWGEFAAAKAAAMGRLQRPIAFHPESYEIEPAAFRD